VHKFRLEQIDESDCCQQAASNVFPTGSANQRAERASRVSVTSPLLCAFPLHCLAFHVDYQSVLVST